MRVKVWDEDGVPIEGASVRIRGLDGYPFDETVESVAGAWVARCVAPGALMDVVATRPGWTTRRLIGTDQHGPMSWTLDFSFGQPEQRWAWSASYFLSDYPEVEDVEITGGRSLPLNDRGDASWVHDPANMVLELKFSEPFDEATQHRLSQAIRVWPADAITGNPAAIDVAAYANADEGDGLRSALDMKLDFPPFGDSLATHGAINAGLGGRAHANWNADGRTLTFTIDGVLGADGKLAAYQVGLVSDGSPFRALDGHALGTDQFGVRDTAVPAGRLVANVFWPPGVFHPLELPRIDEQPSGGRQRWNATHYSTFRFLVQSPK